MGKKMFVVTVIIIVLSISASFARAGNETGSNTWYGDQSGGGWAGGGAGDNSFFGMGAGFHVSDGASNTLIGSAAGTNLQHGSYNTFLGSWTCGLNGQSFNTCIGYKAGYLNGLGNGNVLLGYKAGYDEHGSNMLYIDNCLSGEPCHQPFIKGDFSAKTLDIDGALTAAGVIHSTSGGIQFPDGTTQSTAVNSLGSSTLTYLGNNTGTSSGTNGGDLFIGSYAGYSNSSGSYNSFVGIDAGYANNAGSSNSLVGYEAGFNNTSGSNNTFVGKQAGYNSSSGNFNTFIGSTAGGGTTGHPGYSNVFIGAGTGYNNTGNGNVFVGNSAGYSSDAGNYNVFIGTNAAHDVTESYRLYISSSNSYPTTPLIYGEFDNNLVQINGQLVFPSDERLKKNIEPLKAALEKVVSLNGVSYEWKADVNNDRGFSKGREIGLIAQEVETVLPELVHTDSKGYKSLTYDRLVPVLIEAIKEQQKVIDQKSRMLDEQQAAIKMLTEKLEKLDNIEAKLNRLESKNISAQK